MHSLITQCCTNTWFDRADFSAVILAGKTVTNYVDYYDRGGTNSFERSAPAETASRDLDEQVSEAIYYEVTDTVGSGGSGGGA